jgi:hypothetical protein
MGNLIKSIDEILGLSDEEYTIFFGNLIKEEDALYTVDELDDELLKSVDRRPVDVERVCHLNSMILSKLKKDEMRTPLLAYNFNTLMIAAICQNNISGSKSTFIEGIAFCRKNKQYEAGHSLSQNVFRLFASGQLPHDEAVYFLAQITEFYNALEKHQDTIEALCAAALYFAHASAFQSAYRAIHDAQQIALSHKMLHLQCRILETQGMVALVEGDLSCADAEFQKCFEICKTLGETPPVELISNAALVKLRKEEYGAARDIYKALLNDYAELLHTTQNSEIKINLIVCYRELGDISAIEDLLPQIEKDLTKCDLEARIEARLILAKTCFHLNKLPQGTAHLKEACIEIQCQIDQYQRLHYRRGIRGRYVSRLRSMLMSMKSSGDADDVLHALVLCSSNALLDWFLVLDWIDLVMQSVTVPNLMKEELLAKRDNLLRFGTPFLYGFREKYDDPFEFANGKIAEELGERVTREMDYSLPWREFNDLTAQICQVYSYPSPFEGASILRGVNLLSQRLLTGSAFLFSFACAEGCALIFVAEGQYFRTDISLDNLWPFIRALHEYQRGDADRNTFHRYLLKLQTILEPTMTNIVDLLENSSISELVFIPDHLTEGFPIVPAILTSEQLRSRIRESGLVFRTCPALSEESTDSSVTGPSLCISDSGEHLDLAESEKALIKKTFAGQDYFEIDLQYEEVDFSQPPANVAKLLHLVTHNVPANTFSDPFFVSTSTDSAKNAVWLESIQREAHKLPLTLAVLNGCNTGTTSNRNYFKGFSTNEKVGLSSAFLLTRRCAVVATQWNEPEIVGYVFSALFYNRLSSQPNAARAFILSLMDLYELTKEGAISLMANVLDEKVRQRQCEALKQSQDQFPFRNLYCLGMFQFHSLLVRIRL